MQQRLRRAEIASIRAASQPISSVASAPRSSVLAGRLEDRDSTRSTSSASGRWKTLACDSSTLPTPSARERAHQLAALRVGAHQHRDVAGAQRAVAERDRALPRLGEQARDLARRSPRRRRARRLLGAAARRSGVGGSVHTCSRRARQRTRRRTAWRGLSPSATGR